jgi:hypothetical protein
LKKGTIKVKNQSLGWFVGNGCRSAELFVDEVFELFLFEVLDSIFGVFDKGSDFLFDGVGSEHIEFVELVAATFEELDKRVLFVPIQSHFAYDSNTKLPSTVNPLGVCSFN